MDTKSIYKFLKEIAKHNDREWFAANRPMYDKAKENIDALAEMLIALIAEVDPEASRLRVPDVTYRIYRDTRFSLDKTPYKTHVGIFINPPEGKKSLRNGYYFHLEPGASLLGCGNLPGPTNIINAIRGDIYANVDEYLEIIDDPEFKKYFPKVGEDCLVKAPKGFPKDWEYIDLLKPRSFGSMIEVPDSFYTESDTLADRLRPMIRQMKRYNDFINYVFD